MWYFTVVLSLLSVTAVFARETAKNAYEDVVFHLYTPLNPSFSQVIKIDDPASLRESNLNASLPTRVVVHGHVSNINDGFMQQTKNQYLLKGQYNVIAVDWGVQAAGDYGLVRTRLFAVGTVVGQFIEFLIRAGGVNVNDVVLAGFSFGAHVVGNAGKRLNGSLPCIFGLDPAGPLFFDEDTDRFMITDAKYVEAIHSNAGAVGYRFPLAHADFYPNGGSEQPGCGGDNGCAHGRAPSFFIESINAVVKFTGRRCHNFESIRSDDCDYVAGETKVMGGEPFTVGNGVYHLVTNANSPFARG